MRLSPTINWTAVENAAMVTKLALSHRVAVIGCEMETLNNEQSTAIGGATANEFVPELIVFHVEDVGVGAAANGDIQVSVGNSSGGTQLLVATALTNLISLNQHYIVAVDGLTSTMLADGTLYVKVTTADTHAGVGHLLDAYILGTLVVSGT